MSDRMPWGAAAAGPISPNSKEGCAQGAPATRRECDTSLKNSKSAIKLLQVELVPRPPNPEFSRLNTHNGATHRRWPQ
jgi:hypothetical protein